MAAKAGDADQGGHGQWRDRAGGPRLFCETVNLTDRLCDLGAPGLIWATQALGDAVMPPPGARVRSLGPIPIR